mgnify:CR=1 FL=1
MGIQSQMRTDWRMRVVLMFMWAGLLLAQQATGQNLDILDSLQSVLTTQSGKDQFETLNAIGFEYRYSFPDSTIFYCNKAYELGKSLGLPKDLSKPLSFIGLAYANKGAYNQSAEYHERAIQIAQEQQDSVQLGFGYNNLGRMFFDGGDVERATTNLVQAKEIFEQLNDKSGLAYVYRSLANIYNSQRDFNQAVAMSAKALKLRTELGDKRAIISSLLELGLIYESYGQPESALLKLNQADSLAKLIHDQVTLAEVEQTTAEVLAGEGNYEQAHVHASKVLDILQQITNQRLLIRALLVRGKYLAWKKQCTPALRVLDEVMEKSEHSGFLTYQIEASQAAARCYQALGNKAREQEMLNRYTILQEKINSVNLQQQIERLEFQLQIARQERENELLKASQFKSENLLNAQRFENRILILMVILISVVSIFLWSYNRRRKIVNQKLHEQNDRILKQQEEISKVNEHLKHQNALLNELNNEKNSLMNIVAHDLKSPLNRITGLASIMELEGDLPEKQQEYVKLIKQATKSGSNMIIDLLDVNAFEENGNFPVMAEFHIEPWLEDRVNTFRISAEAKRIKLNLVNQLTGAFYSDVDYLNRIADNLISNAIKFSPPNREVFITGKMEDGNLILSIKDQAPGFSAQDKVQVYKKFKKLSARPTAGESSNGLGLAIVKTLVDRLHGQISLHSEPGKGSEFVVIIPPAIPK